VTQPADRAPEPRAPRTGRRRATTRRQSRAARRASALARAQALSTGAAPDGSSPLVPSRPAGHRARRRPWRRAAGLPGTLAVTLLRPTRLRDRLRLLLRSALRQLDEDGRVQSFCAAEFEVRSLRRELGVVMDGETLRLRPPLRFRAVPDAVRLIVPAAG